MMLPLHKPAGKRATGRNRSFLRAGIADRINVDIIHTCVTV